MSSASALRILESHPDQVTEIFLNEPLGTSEGNIADFSTNTLRTIIETPIDLLQNPNKITSIKKIARAAIALAQTTKDSARHPSIAAREAYAASNYDMRHDLQRASEFHHKIITLISKESDRIVNSDHTQNFYSKNRQYIHGGLHLIDGIRGGHNSFWIHPEHTARLVGSLIRRNSN